MQSGPNRYDLLAANYCKSFARLKDVSKTTVTGYTCECSGTSDPLGCAVGIIMCTN